jgi:hypothetical protein
MVRLAVVSAVFMSLCFSTGLLAADMNQLMKKAERGNTQAQFELGYKYRTGEGVPHDYPAAMEWLRRAADKGHAAAQMEIGYMYEHGCGVKQDYYEAMKCYKRSARIGLDGEANKWRPHIDLFDLLSMYMVPSHKLATHPGWTTGVEAGCPINWKTRGEWDEKREAFVQKGEVLLEPQRRSRCVEPVPWTITVSGARSMVSKVELARLTPWCLDIEEDFAKHKIEFELYKCDPEGYASEGKRLYKIRTPGKKPAWFHYEWTSGSGGCWATVRLLLSHKDAEALPGLERDCSKAKASRRQ